MSTLVLVSTSDVRRAVQVAMERWEVDLQDISRTTLLPRAGANHATPPDDLLDEIITRVQRQTARPIGILADEPWQLTRSLKRLAALQGADLACYADLGEEAWVESEGRPLPTAVVQEAFTIDLVNGAGLGEGAFVGLALAPRGAGGRAVFRPDLTVLNAIDVTWPGAHRQAEVLALSNDPVAIDAVAVGLYRALRGRGSATVGPIRGLPAFAGVEWGETFPLSVEADGATAQELTAALGELEL